MADLSRSTVAAVPSWFVKVAAFVAIATIASPADVVAKGLTPGAQEAVCNVARTGDQELVAMVVERLRNDPNEDFTKLRAAYGSISCGSGLSMMGYAMLEDRKRMVGHLVLKYQVPLNTYNSMGETELDYFSRKDIEVDGGGSSSYGRVIHFLRNMDKVTYEKAMFRCEIEGTCTCSEPMRNLEKSCR